jgi:PAS domain S-box-containing protein
MNDEGRSEADSVRESQELREKLRQSQCHSLAVESELAEVKKTARERLAEIDTIYENAGFGLCVLDKEMRYVRINDELARMNGVPPADHLGKTVREIVPELYDAAEPIFRKVMESGEPVRGLKLDGETAALPGVMRHWVEQWLPLKSPDDETTGVAVVVEEITAREQAEKALRESENTFRAIAELNPFGAWECDAHGGVIYLSQSWLDMVGMTLEQCREFGWTDRYAPGEADKMLESWRRCIEAGTRWEYEHHIRDRNDCDRWVLSRGFPLRDEQGRITKWVGLNIDITNRKRAEEELQRLNETLEEQVRDRTRELTRANAELRATLRRLSRLGDVVNRSPAVVFRWQVAEDWPVETVSENVKQWGYTAYDFVSGRVTWPGVTHPDDVPRLEAEVNRYLTEGTTEFTQEYRIIAKSGEVRWCEDRNHVVKNSGGVVTHIEGIVLDVTEQKRLHQQVIQSEQKYRTLAENTSDIPYVLDRHGTITYIGPQVARYGFAPDHFLSKSIQQVVLPNDRESVTADFERSLTHDKEFPTEFRFAASDGTVHWLEDCGAVRHDADGKAVGISGVLRDVTERKRLEKAMAELAEQERCRFSQELHDGLGQEITAIALMLSTLRTSLGDESPHAELATKLERTIESTKTHLRALARGLFPVAVDASGLGVALENLAEETAKTYGIECVFKCRQSALVEDNFVATQLFLIAREAVHNAAKHAQPPRIVIQLEDRDGVTLTVRDEGTGIAVDLERAAGMGVRIMRHRCSLIGANLEFACPADGGTIVTCVLRGSD